jgi:hypothetical protein
MQTNSDKIQTRIRLSGSEREPPKCRISSNLQKVAISETRHFQTFSDKIRCVFGA